MVVSVCVKTLHCLRCECDSSDLCIIVIVDTQWSGSVSRHSTASDVDVTVVTCVLL